MHTVPYFPIRLASNAKIVVRSLGTPGTLAADANAQGTGDKMAVTQAGLEGIVAAESNICFIDGDAGILSYQGYNIHTWPSTPRLRK